MKKIYKFSLDLILLNIGSIILFIVIFIPIVVTNKWLKININMNFIMLMILWMALHELLHGIGFSIFKEVKHKNIKYGIALEKGVFYCMCQQKISKCNILTSLMFPLTFIGIITLVIGLLIRNITLVLLSIVNISGAIGDIAMFISILLMPKNIEYIDFDDNTGFYLISEHDLSKSKLIGFKYDSVKEWDDNINMPQRKKITISKQSWIVLLILHIITIIDNLLR